MKRSLFLLIYNICWHVVVAIKSDDIPISPKDFTQEFRKKYSHRHKLESRDFIQPNLNQVNDYQEKIRQFYNLTSLHHGQRRLIKKSNITYPKHRRKKVSEQERQLINTPIDDVVDNIGKAYGDPDNYQNIGDGVYLLSNKASESTNDQQTSNKQSATSLKDSLPAAERTLNKLIGNLEEADREVLNDPPISAGRSYNLDDGINDNEINVNMKNKIQTNQLDNDASQIPSDNSPNEIEGIIPREFAFINQIEKKLSDEDSKTNENLKTREDTYTKSFEKAQENSKQHLKNVAKEVESSDNDILTGKSLPLDDPEDYDIESLKDGSNHFKKDVTTKYVSRNKKRKYKQHKRKKLEPSYNSKPEIIIGGSRSYRKPKEKPHDSDSKISSKEKETTKESNDGDTGFFIADENDIADLNKNTENFVENTVNASVIKIIEPHNKSKSKRRNFSEMKAPQNLTSKNSSKRLHQFDQQDVALYKALNKTIDTKYKHKGYWKPIDQGNINISHRKGVTQIDLYLLNSHKGRKRRNKLVRKANTPQANSAADDNQVYADDVEDVSVNEAANNQAKQMYADNGQGNDYSTKGGLESLQNSHIEGNENKHDEVSIQDAINSEELKYAMKESDLKGLNQIQNELDFQDTKNAIDYFNQPDPSTAKSISAHRISSNTIGDITDQIKDVETSAFDNDVDKAKSPEDEQQKVKIILHIPENMSSSQMKSKTKDLKDTDNTSSLDSLSEQAKAYLNSESAQDIFAGKKPTNLSKELTKDVAEENESETTSNDVSTIESKNNNNNNNKLDDETLEAAKKIEEFIKQESKKKSSEDTEEVTDHSKSTNQPVDGNVNKEDPSPSLATRLGLPKKEETDQTENIKTDSKKLSQTLKVKADTDKEKTEETVKPIENKESKPENSKQNVSLEKPTNNNTIKIVDSKNANDEKLTEYSSSDLLKAINLVKEQQIKVKNDSTKTNSSQTEDSELRYTDILPEKPDPLFNPHPTTPQPLLQKFIKTIHDHALSKEPLKTTAEGVLPNFEDASIQGIIKAGGAMPLRINGGKVLGGSVRGGSIFGGVVSGGDVSGGEIHGGRMMGGTFKNGLLENGVIENGNIEGGKIKGGRIAGGNIKSGVIEGGEVKGGTIEGGHLFNGTIEGGDFKGGEIYGGRLISGEMDGGVMKNGSINGGLMKGGLIESGELQGGIMLSGVLRGGIIKSGIIRGGVIDKGVVVQDAEIGPGVEIHEGVIKGGKITVNSISQGSSIPQIPGPQDASYLGSLIPEGTHTDENRSNIMYSIQVLPKPADSYKASVIKPTETPIKDKKDFESMKKYESKKLKDEKEFLLKSLNTMGGGATINPVKKGKSPSDKTLSTNIATHPKLPAPKITLKPKLSRSSPKPNPLSDIKDQILPNKLFQHGTLKAIQALRQHHGTSNTKYINNLLNMLESSAKKSEEESEMQKQTTVRMFEENQRKRNEEATLQEDPPIAHWAITDGTKNYILGAPGAKLRMSGGITIRHGHAILDGINGYFDGGDYQGECMSDPEVCSNGFTVQMTLKVYKDSVFNATRLFIFDTGATSTDSRGISIWVNEGRIGTQVSTREEVFCTRKILEPFIEKWVSMTLTWRKDKGLLLYINCELFDESLHHATSECDVCKESCHQSDRATRLMIGRPNKGPHFRVTHMAVGDILLHDRYSDKDDVKLICGSQEVRTKPAVAYTQQTQNTQQAFTSSTNITSPQADYNIANLSPPVDTHAQTTQVNSFNSQAAPLGQLLQEENGSTNQISTSNTPQEQNYIAPSVAPAAQSNAAPLPVPSVQSNSIPSIAPAVQSNVLPSVAPDLQNNAVASAAPAAAVPQSNENTMVSQTRSNDEHTEAPLPPPAPAPPSPFIVHINTPHKEVEENPWPTPSSVKKRLERDKATVKPESNVWPTPAFRRRTKEKVTTTSTTPFYIDMNADRRSLFSAQKRSERNRQASVNGGYSEWTSWSPCSQNCGKGIQIAVRYCNNPLPKGSGKECTDLGAPRRFQECLLKECTGSPQENMPTSTIRLDYGTKKSIVPAVDTQKSPMIIINGKQESLQDLANAFEQLKHR